MDNNNRSQELIRVDLKEFLFHLLANRVVVTILILVCMISGFAYSKLTYVPKYESVAKIYIINSNAETVTSTEIAISTYLARDYSEMIIDRTVLNEVNASLKLGMSYNSLKNCVSVVAPDDTRILEVHVTTTDPQKSQRIANEICLIAKDKIETLMDVDRVNVFSKAYLPSKASGSKAVRNAIYGLGVGILLSAVYVFILYSINDKIINTDDIEKHLNIPALGAIPYHNNKTARKSKYAKYARKA